MQNIWKLFSVHLHLNYVLCWKSVNTRGILGELEKFQQRPAFPNIYKIHLCSIHVRKCHINTNVNYNSQCCFANTIARRCP